MLRLLVLFNTLYYDVEYAEFIQTCAAAILDLMSLCILVRNSAAIPISNDSFALEVRCV